MLTLQYDGTDFAGWQVQPNAPTIQGEIERALHTLYGRDVPLVGSGRTDAGVHALAQVANFTVTDEEDRILLERVPLALNTNLPPAIRIHTARYVSKRFHARFSAGGRKYVYVLSLRKQSPFLLRYSYFRARVPDIARLNAYAKEIVGAHDFTSFCSSRDMNESKVRRVLSAQWRMRGETMLFFIHAHAFLHNMVRVIVGTSLKLAEKGGDANAMREILLAKDRNKAFATAPPQGLFLREVYYEYF